MPVFKYIVNLWVNKAEGIENLDGTLAAGKNSGNRTAFKYDSSTTLWYSLTSSNKDMI